MKGPLDYAFVLHRHPDLPYSELGHVVALVNKHTHEIPICSARLRTISSSLTAYEGVSMEGPILFTHS